MSDHETPERAAYLRSVTFLDTDPNSGSADLPVHVTGRVLFDGEPVTFVRDAHLELPGRTDAAVLVLTVDADAVHTDLDAEDVRDRYRLGGFPVLLPADAEVDEEGAVVGREPRFWEGNGDGTWTVAVFVDHVRVQPHTFGDKVVDGDQPGTIVRCPGCGGTGELHEPDGELARVEVEAAR